LVLIAFLTFATLKENLVPIGLGEVVNTRPIYMRFAETRTQEDIYLRTNIAVHTGVVTVTSVGNVMKKKSPVFISIAGVTSIV
jgi:hypothetical protein